MHIDIFDHSVKNPATGKGRQVLRQGLRMDILDNRKLRLQYFLSQPDVI
jgi:hypothetical protein